MSLSNTVENQLLSALLALYPNLYLALSSTDPGEDGSGITEPAVGSYARVLIGTVTLSGSNITNNNPVTFATSTAAWGTIAYVAVFSAETGGTFIGKAQIVSFDVPASMRISVASGTTIVSLD